MFNPKCIGIRSLSMKASIKWPTSSSRKSDKPDQKGIYTKRNPSNSNKKFNDNKKSLLL